MDINKDYISKNNTYAGQNRPKYIVIHETDNYADGAGAQRHASAQAAGHLGMSVQYYSGSDGIYQAAGHSDGTYSIGVEYGGSHEIKDATNRNTINIEICVNPDGDYAKARANAIELVKYLIRTTGIPADRVIRHFDAKGKYCPRKMMDDPKLWEDFKKKIGHVVKEEPVQGVDKGKEAWYRVGTGWKDGICQNQSGAYHNRDFAIADCKAGQYVYDSSGNVVYAGGGASGGRPDSSYTQRQFVIDVQGATGSRQDGMAGDETLGNTMTVSRNTNKHHAAVTPLERRLKALGYYAGEVEADRGEPPCFGKGMEAAVNEYQKKVLGYKNPDGEITAKKKMWKSLLGVV
ncbi:MAG: N-acetylmuramoyl-L-alanine amidase [Lachnospiraceae bacterium]|jgi:hypothetical protein|nr:N-acetylmuramoyl-L-alanine amidase [Lachnospiraceae bacterium]